MQLYELELNEGRRISPFVWRVKLAMAHKGISADTIGIGFGEKDKIAFSGQGLVPVLRDGEHIVSDSWHIASYLEDNYPDTPSIFGGPVGRGLARFAARWTDITMLGNLAVPMMPCVFDHVPERDRDYFRQDREKRFGMTLEEMRQDPEAKIAAFRQVLLPMRVCLRDQPFLSGDTPAYADFCVFGGFIWAASVSDYKLLSNDDLLYAWRERMMGRFEALISASPGVVFT